MIDHPTLVVDDAAAWRGWLDAHEADSDGVRLVLAKRGTTSPTSLTYAQALEEALCSGWIDGRRNAIDDATFAQHFTPRRARSIWSLRNVGIVAELEAAGRMRARGRAEVARAKADGRWDRAYAGQAAAEPPPELAAALAATPAAAAAFAALTSAERYSLLHPILVAAGDERRSLLVARAVDRLGQSSTAATDSTSTS